MKQKKSLTRKVFALFLTAALVLSSIMVDPSTVLAAGWLEYATQTITLGTSVSGSIKDGDYYGLTELDITSNKYYWHIYKFTMPKKGLLNIYLESLSDQYLKYIGSNGGFAIFSTSDPDKIVWRSRSGQNQIPKNYSASRSMYYGSTEIALEEGDYYFAVRQYYTTNTPYSLTLSYKEPVINVSSISLSPSSLSMEIGDLKTIIPTVLPDNATDKTVVWKSENPSIATVENGIVKAVSIGTTSITVSSLDGEIKTVCPVTVQCNHNYKSSLSPAGIDYNGYISNACTKCGIETKEWIAAIDSIELSASSYYYDGEVHKPSVTVLDTNGNALEDGKDYVISYPDNMIDIGTYTATIDFKGNYEGTEKLVFRVLPVSVESISLDVDDITLETGAQQKVIATVLPDNATDKTVVWKSENPSIATVENGIVKAVSIGTTSITASSLDGEIKTVCPVTVQCNHNYKSSLSPAGIDYSGYISKICTKCDTETKEWIAAIDSIKLSATSYCYDGKVHKPSVTVLDYDGNALEDGEDFVISYPDNMIDIDTYTVTVDFKGNYEGTKKLDFTILPVPVESIFLDADYITLETGAQQKVTATVLPDNATNKSILWISSDPSVLTVDGNGVIKAISVGTASVIAATVDGDETASCTVKVVSANALCSHDYHTTLIPAAQNRNGVLTEECVKCGNKKQSTTIYAISDISLSISTYVYNGKTQTPSVIVKDTMGKILQNNTDYTISYTGNQKDVGIHTVTVTFKGNYSGSTSKQFTIYPASTTITKIKSKKKGFTVSWEKQPSQITGYEVQYSTNSKFTKKGTGTVIIDKNKTISKSVSKLKAKKKYYVRMRTYKTVNVNGKSVNLYSGWSMVKTIKTKK